MPRLPDVVIRERDHFFELSMAHDDVFNAHAKTIPGCRKTRDGWDVPKEVLPLVESYLPKDRDIRSSVISAQFYIGDDSPLRDYQVEACNKIIDAGYNGMLNFEMGLGKTACAITLARSIYKQNVFNEDPYTLLVVCPAVVRLNWAKEIEKWWDDYPEIIVHEKGSLDDICSTDTANTNNKKNRIIITSYALVERCEQLKCSYIICDESHYLKNEKTKRYKSVRRIKKRNPNSPTLLLTGTPITAEPRDLYAQLELLWPGRFGSFWKFVNRYCEVVSHEFGHRITGINPVYHPELKTRLGAVSCRVTKAEVKEKLPPIILQSVRFRDDKLKRTTELVHEVRNGECRNVAIITHLRETAELLARSIDGSAVIHGGLTPRQRFEKLQEAKGTPGSTICCTMHSIGTGIDLTEFTVAIFAELYEAPAEVTQCLGRFNRLNSTEPANVFFMVQLGTRDEAVAGVLEKRLKDQSKLFASGVGEEKIMDAFNLDDESFMEELLAAAESFVEEAV